MIYCDTSLLVSVLLPEATSPAARAWYFTSSRARCGVSPWTITEVASALARKHRNGLLDDAQRQIVEHGWSAMQAELDQLPIGQRHFRQAAALVDVAPRGLRSGDALHLASRSTKDASLPPLIAISAMRRGSAASSCILSKS
ncbi:type II toxin-antitoxin system VapC family toxin [Sphingomonas sp. KR1UV-12]|uniref:Type II toxin-antitoxin system VapC family toxin n=1 Tax=Sphingomonas aurea TaxID=3063994 RepID=A0ABT9EK77_9SPHN|nr:type II toxin-antitoxin system VapC family toxin [Sphingomonas sp. KR1UV-12]MDP1027193.1 type II toxin-antitoxin system VapC family toxin [Sphingomonas sp. KR1UV-12]